MAELATSSTVERAGIETFVPIKPDRIAQLMRRERFRFGLPMTIPRLCRRASSLRSEHAPPWAAGPDASRGIPLNHAKQTA